MSFSRRDIRFPAHIHLWKWWFCGLLLLATLLNYMDRLTLNLLGVSMMEQLSFSKQDYGHIEAGFAVAFALGAIVMGFAVDRFGVYWVYPLSVLGWSVAGYLTGYSTDFWSLFTCRVVLGLAESGNWPSALRATQRLLPPEERTMGNSILQSGAAFGAVLTPAIVQVLVPESAPESWPAPFFVIGALGLSWVALWFVTVRAAALGPAEPSAAARAALGLTEHIERAPLPRGLFLRRFAALVILVITINACWHFYRAWLPLFLQQEQGYTQSESNGFFTLYYLAAGIGSWAAGLATLWIVRMGMPVHRGRLLVFFGFALLAALGVAAAFVPSGPWLPVLLLLVAVGALGVFPNYYSFSQELTTTHQGKLTGVLGCSCWLAMAALHEIVGYFMASSPSYRPAIAMVALLPLVGVAALLLLWGKNPLVRSAEAEENAYPLRAPTASGVDSRFGVGAVITIKEGE